MLDGDNAAIVALVGGTPDTLSVLSRFLAREGYGVRPLHSTSDILDALRREPPDLILLDVSPRPGDAGFIASNAVTSGAGISEAAFTLCRELKADETLSGIPVIFLTPREDNRDVLRAFEAGAADYITRPFQPPELVARVRAHVRLRQQGEHLRRVNENQRKLFAVIAHDLRNPFSGLLAFPSLIADGFEMPPDELKRTAAQARDRGGRVLDLLQNLLQWARLQMDQVEFSPTMVKATDLVAETFKLAAYHAEAKGVQLDNQVADDFRVRADARMLQTILRNLISNGIKYAKAGGRVTVYAQADESGASIRVRDDGIGMSPRRLSEVLRAGSPGPGDSVRGTADESGTGMGLVLCRLFAERHGGELRGRSEPDQGSEFEVWFRA